MAIDLSAIPSPKRPLRPVRGRSSWYPFYPGFSDSFSSAILRQLRISSAVVLDSWNGAGTTTATAARLGLGAVGIDLNPAMVVAARSRLLDPLDGPSLRPLGAQILQVARSKFSEELDSDPLSELFWPQGVGAIRAIELAIREVLVDSSRLPCSAELFDDMSPLACFFYVALFRTAKQLLAHQAGSNPVWTRMRLSHLQRARPTRESVRAMFAKEVCAMAGAEIEGRPSPRATSPRVQIRLASSTRLPLSDDSAQLALCSPPYCTRVDYAVATFPELAILGYERDTSFDQLRRSLIGTTTVESSADVVSKKWGPTCVEFLEAVKDHHSRASSTYYYKNHARYFAKLFSSMCELSRVVSPGGSVVMVVQDSYYKDIHNDLPRVVSEMGASVGMECSGVREFPLKRLLAVSNPKVRKYRGESVSAVESVVALTVH
jgi:hypothetical protein